MPSEEIKVELNVINLLHDALKNSLQEFYDKTGVKVTDVNVNWVDHISKSHLVSVTVTTEG